MKTVFYTLLVLLLSLIGTFSYASSSDMAVHTDYVKSLDGLLKAQDENASLLEAKLTIDKLIDPKLDIPQSRDKIAHMVSKIEGMIAPSARDWDKLVLIRKYVYEAGEWNKFKPFSYDLNDPLGESRKSRLIHNYLNTRKGNCVSMPVLHAILGQELGLNMTISTAPLHVFVRYKDEKGEAINIEATSGGHAARLAWYQENLPMLPRAIKNRVFLADLTPRETVAVLGHDLASELLQNGDYKNSILVSEKLLEVFPNYAPLHLTRGSGYYKLIERDFKRKYPNPEDIPEDQQQTFKAYMTQNTASFKIAESLGWADPDELLEKRQLAGQEP